MHSNLVQHVICLAIRLNALITNDSRIRPALHARTFAQTYDNPVTFIGFENRAIKGPRCDLQL